jgi:branched-chain amino acid aminotransferase
MVAAMAQIWCNGQWLDGGHYPGAALDRGAFLGLGLFETMLAVDGKLPFADRHLARWQASGERFGWSLVFPDLPEVAAGLLNRNQLHQGPARVRLMATAGSGLQNDLIQGGDRLIWLAAMPLKLSSDPVAVCLSPWPRNERSPLAGMKTSSYAENLVALDDARRRGFDETIFLNTAGDVCEAATANVFVVKGEVLHSPPLESGCLPGIGREVLLELAAANGLAFDSRPLQAADLNTADEMFLSSATRGPVAVGHFEERAFSSVPVTAAMQTLWRQAIGRAHV